MKKCPCYLQAVNEQTKTEPDMLHIICTISYRSIGYLETLSKLKFHFRRAKERKITKRKSDGEGAEDQNEGSLSPQSYTS